MENEVVQEVRKKKKEGLVCMINWEKENDCMEWDLADIILEVKGFGEWKTWD